MDLLRGSEIQRGQRWHVLSLKQPCNYTTKIVMYLVGRIGHARNTSFEIQKLKLHWAQHSSIRALCVTHRFLPSPDGLLVPPDLGRRVRVLAPSQPEKPVFKRRDTGLGRPTGRLWAVSRRNQDIKSKNNARKKKSPPVTKVRRHNRHLCTAEKLPQTSKNKKEVHTLCKYAKSKPDPPLEFCNQKKRHRKKVVCSCTHNPWCAVVGRATTESVLVIHMCPFLDASACACMETPRSRANR